MARAGISLREWQIAAADYETEEDFRQAVTNELAEFEHMGERLGVGLIAAPIRREVTPGFGDFYTAGWLFKTATVPPVRGEESADEADRLAASLAPSIPDEDLALVEDAA